MIAHDLDAFRRHRLALLSFALFNLLDVASTWLGLRAGLHEANILPSALPEWGMYALKGIGTLMAVAMAVRLGRRWPGVWIGFYVATGAVVATVWGNLLLIAGR